MFFARLLGWNHEQAWGFHGPGGTFQARPQTAPEVSWLAAPFLGDRHTVILLTRDPLRTVATIAARGVLAPGACGDFVRRYVDTGDPWEFWMQWTGMVARRAEGRVRLEDVSRHLPPVNVTLPPPPPLEVPDRLRDAVAGHARTLGYDLTEKEGTPS